MNEAGPVTPSVALPQFAREAHRGVCDTPRYRCPYYVWGDGPNILFIPGLCDDGLSFAMPIALLRDRFRCIAYDLPTGDGDGARLADYRHADYVADVFAVLDHVGARESFVYGSSFGATIALAAMHADPERFPKAVLQGGFARRPLAWAELLLASWARWWPGPMRRLPLREAILRRSHFGPFADSPEETWRFFLERSGAPPMSTVAHRALLLHQVDLRSLLPEISQPTLLICGDCDPLVGKDCENVLRGGLPVAARAEIVGCGHMPQFTHPGIVAELVTRFLSPAACGSAGEC